MKKFLKITLVTLFALVGLSHGQQIEDLPEEDQNRLVPDAPLEFYPQSRIVRGRTATEGQFPYQVSLRKNGQHTCGGSIISKEYILTAAHCVTRTIFGFTLVLPAILFSVRSGSNDLASGGVISRVAEIKVPKNYRGSDNDVALLRLSTPLTFDNRTSAIELNSAVVPPGAEVLTSGWGRVGRNAPLSNQLQFIQLIAISTAQCKRFIRNINDGILCLAHRRDSGVCSGDSGGPAVYQNRLVGVTNFVINTCATNAPDGFAKVSVQVPWIQSNSDVEKQS